MQSAKDNISKIVSKYIKEFPKENEALKKAVIMKRALYAQGFEKGTDMRPLYELTQALHGFLVKELSEDEMKWFKTKKGGNWFAKKFKAYSFI